jgi:hypothetical protein
VRMLPRLNLHLALLLLHLLTLGPSSSTSSVRGVLLLRRLAGVRHLVRMLRVLRMLRRVLLLNVGRPGRSGNRRPRPRAGHHLLQVRVRRRS